MHCLEDREEKRVRMLEEAKNKVREAFASGDHSIIQAINTYMEIDRIKNLLSERLYEWYGIYFPDVRSGSQDAYARLASEVRRKEDADIGIVEKIFGEGANKVIESLNSENSRDIPEEEHAAIRKLAEGELRLAELQESIDAYLSEETKKHMPNITYLIEYRIAAELLAKAGSLVRLANMPSGTIQLLGAEKALFKHMKFGSKPPKYGILYKLAEISNAPKEKRGRLARAYATKISIAARADAYTKRFIADKLKESLKKNSK